MAAFVIGPLLAGVAVVAAGPALPVAADAATSQQPTGCADMPQRSPVY